MSNAVSQTFTLQDSATLNYRIDGPENADWIILSNSLATDLRLFDHEVSYLSKTMRVLRFDTRGHGKSSSSAPPYDFSTLCGDLLELMDHLKIECADMLGVSLGGMTALAMAIAYPERVNRILCCDARADAPDAYKAIWDVNIDKMHAQDLAALCEPTLTRWFTASFLENKENEAKLDMVRDMFLATSPDGYEGCGRCLQTLDLLQSLPKLSHKTLYMTGEHDMAAPVAVMQAMADTTPGSTFKVIPDAAHLSNLEQPEIFARNVSAFLGL